MNQRTIKSLEVPIDRNFDEKFANKLAMKESFNKHLYRPNTYLHKWWARRCGTTFRNILKYLSDDIENHDYYSPGGLEGKTILDPMMGGGTTLHEAIRLGGNVIGVDIDPIPVLQARASLTEIPLNELEDAFSDFYSTLRKELSQYYRTVCNECGKTSEAQYFLYGLKKSCKCKTVLSIDSTILRYESDGSIIKICPKCHEIYKDKDHQCKNENENITPLIEKGDKECNVCKHKYKENIDIPYSQRYVPFAIVGKCEQHGLFFKNISNEDKKLIEKARSEALREIF